MRDGNEIFHIPVILVEIDVKKFVDRSQIVVAWETHDMMEHPQSKKLDICFNSLNPFLDTMWSCYDNFQ